MLIWGGPGSGRTGLLGAALEHEGVKLVATTARAGPPAAEPVADLVERKLYLKSKWAAKLPEIAKLLDRSKLENIVTDRTAATSTTPTTPARSTGAPRSASSASKKGRIVLDPYWFGGGTRHVRRTAPKVCVLLAPRPGAAARSRSSSRARPPGCSRAASSRAPAGKALPFLNPHLAGLDAARSDQLQTQHERLFAATKVVIVNTAVGEAEALARRIRDLIA